MFVVVSVAVVVALAVGLFYRAIAGRPGVAREAAGIFALALLATSAVGAWVVPFEPILHGGYWVPFAPPTMVVLILLAVRALARHSRAEIEPVLLEAITVVPFRPRETTRGVSPGARLDG